MRVASILANLVGWALLAALLLAGIALVRGWQPVRGELSLDLADTPRPFTGRKLAALTDDRPRCAALLERAGVRFVRAPAVGAERCGYADGVRFATGGARRIALAPAGVATSCAVAAGLALWEWHVVQPAARRHFGEPVTRIDHFGSYSCRRIGGGGGAYSEHSTADAIDIAGFRLADGTRIGVAADWSGGGPKAAFLRDVHAGACDLFSTVLGPDYNRAHRDHFHLDQAERGARGWRGCR